MNRDQVKGAAKDLAGKAQAKAGEMIGNPEQQGKGMARQAEGKAQKKMGNAKENLKGKIDKL